MALYDAALSCTMGDLEYLEAIVAQSDAMQELAGVTDDSGLAELITLGPMEDPWDSEAHELEELENQLFYLQINPADSYEAVRGPEQHGTARLHTDAEVRIHRQVRETEAEDLQDVWKFYCDRVFYFVETELFEDAKAYDPQLWIASVGMREMPGFLDRTERSGQGERLYSMFVVSLGQRGGEGE